MAELKHAIDFSEFELHYQPIVSLDGGQIGGVEALIDKTFIDRISGAVEGVALVKAIIQFSKSFGLSTVAEGIEEAGQAGRLATLGCLLGQGFLWSRPVLPHEISDALGSQRTAPVREPV